MKQGIGAFTGCGFSMSPVLVRLWKDTIPGGQIFFFLIWSGDCFFAELGPSVQNNGGMFFNMNCENMMEIIKVKLIQMWEIF